MATPAAANDVALADIDAYNQHIAWDYEAASAEVSRAVHARFLLQIVRNASGSIVAARVAGIATEDLVGVPQQCGAGAGARCSIVRQISSR